MKQRYYYPSTTTPSTSRLLLVFLLSKLLQHLLMAWITIFMLCFYCNVSTITTTTHALTYQSPTTKTTMDDGDGRNFVLKYTLANVHKTNNNNNNNNQKDTPSLGPNCIHYKLPNPSEEEEEEEDELEMLYPTSKSLFVFNDDNDDNNSNKDEVTIRTTSFGCGKLGFEIWTASIFLSLYCRSVLLPTIENNSKDAENNNSKTTATTTTIVELGAGCGLPSSMLSKYQSKSQQLEVIATDFWMEPNDEFDKERLIPDYYHGVNLRYNIDQNLVQNNNKPNMATAKRLDWINPKPFIDDVDNNIDWVIGSDIIYYPQDLQYLWNTLEIFLERGTKVIIAATADKRREALPEFIKQLDEKQKANLLQVRKEEWILYQQGTEDDINDGNGGGREMNRFYCFCFEKV